MKLSVILQFITIGVSMMALSVANAEKPKLDISGRWYVAGLGNAEHESEGSSGGFRCWTIDIHPSETKTFNGESAFIITDNGEQYHSSFIINQLDVTPGFAGSEFYTYSLIGEGPSGDEIDIRSMELMYDEKNPVVTIHRMIYANPKNQQWDKIFISRQSNVTAQMIPLADHKVDNSEC